jgi:hypothetical protein
MARMRMEGMGGRIGWLVGVLVISAVSAAHATDLGSDTLAFVLLSTGGKVILGKDSQAGLGGNGGDLGMVGGTAAILDKDSQAVNEVVTKPHGINLHKNAETFGCITDHARIKLAAGARCMSLIDNGGQRPELTTMKNAIGEAALFVSVANSQPPAQNLSKIAVPKNGFQTIVNSQTGLNVITTPSVNLKKGAELDISGQSGETDLILVNGDLKWGADASLLFSGMTDTDLVFVISGKLVSIGRNSQLPATVVAPNATCEVGARAQVFGEMVCGKKISLGDHSQVQYVPTAVTIP